MNILITGASGLIGSSLIEYLFARGHSFFSLQRNKTAQDGFWNLDRIPQHQAGSAIDTVIHLAGENIASGRWTKRKKDRILRSRLEGTEQLADFCASLPDPPKLFISASAIGYYGNRGDEWVDEESRRGDNFVAEVCRQWEVAAMPARNAGIRVINARIGMVLTSHGGTLPTMLPSFKLGIAGIVGSGRQFVSWVVLEDLLRMFEFLLQDETILGPVNMVSPQPVTNKEFTKALGAVVKKPTLLRMPAFVAKAVFGQMGTELVLSSTRVRPSVLLEKGFRYTYRDIDTALHHCLQSSG
jgi:uncharacterized protein (TIGR01777 family)